MEMVVKELSAAELERVKPLPNVVHAAIQVNLAVELAARCRERYRILAGLALPTVPVATPCDLAVYPAFSLDSKSRHARDLTSPLLCVDIDSPSQSMDKLVNRSKSYFRFGVKSCWLVVPAMRAVVVYNLPD